MYYERRQFVSKCSSRVFKKKGSTEALLHNQRIGNRYIRLDQRKINKCIILKNTYRTLRRELEQSKFGAPSHH